MSTLKGGEFLIKEIEAKNIFTMEDLIDRLNQSELVTSSQQEAATFGITIPSSTTCTGICRARLKLNTSFHAVATIR